jgi:cytochrome c556
LPAIWENWPKFEEQLNQMTKEAKRLGEAAATPDKEALKQHFSL